MSSWNVTLSILGLAIAAVMTEWAWAQDAPAPPVVNVEISVFSGMPNPGWSFDQPSELSQLRDFVRGLTETSAPPPPPLGFAGFMLNADEAKCRFPQMVMVFNGVLTIHTAAGSTHYFEDERGLEAFLRAEAERRGLGEFLP